MKKYVSILISFMTVGVLVSCKDYLSTAPGDQIASGNMWTSENLADQGMNGLYRNFYVTNMDTESIFLRGAFEGINRQGWMGMEFQSVYASSEDLKSLSMATKTATDDIIRIEWQWCYTGIHRINDAIENLYKAGLDEEKYERYICEAKFLRAWYYSRLNKIFQGVPLYLEVISESECTKTQSTSTEIWKAVLDDLDYCIASEYFPDNTLSTNYGRPSKGAAYSLRGMAYMWLAWENNDDNSYYQMAAEDFQKVAECGYGLYSGDYIDFFNYNSEKDHEMIFPIQFTEDEGFCDYLQLILAGRDNYEGWSHIRPSYDFVTYYQNADGSTFDWAERIPQWNDAVFLEDINRREVFFLRDNISLDIDNNVVRDEWNETEAGQIKERITRMGLDVFNKYYCKDENGNYIDNEERIRSCYNNRDPRLKETILTPYDPWDTYVSVVNNGNDCVGKELRWPYLRRGTAGGDFYFGNFQESMYAYKKYVYHHKDEIQERLRCPTDWPLIRYTDVYLYLAECYTHLGNLSGAVGIVNEIRSRAGMPSVSVGSYNDVMEAVRYERRVELCIEGADWFDEWRWGTYKDMKFQGKDIYGSQSIWGEWENYIYDWYYTDDMYPWSAPAAECERNPNLKRIDSWAY